MRKTSLLLLVSMFFMSSSVRAEFMSHEDVVAKFQSFEQQKATKSAKSEDALSAGARERFSMVINDQDFFGTKLKKIKDKKINAKAQKGVKSETANFTGNGADLRSKDAPVVSQWNGTCTAHGLAATMENFIGGIDLSERHVWSKYEAYSCGSAINAWEGSGCVTSEAKWPHKSTSPKSGYLEKENCSTYLKKTTYIDDDIQKMINSLDVGHPVYIGMSITNTMVNCDTVMNPKSGRAGGGHALSIVGYKIDSKVPGGGYFIIKNSWGSDCGEKGYQYVPFYLCQRSDLYCIMWTIDEVETKGVIPPSPTPTPTPTPEPNCTQWKRIWYAPWKFKCVAWN